MWNRLSAWRHSLNRRDFRIFVAYVVIGFFAFWIDPFGFEHAARFQLQDAVLQALADWRAAKPEVAVVLWDENDLETLRGSRRDPAITWPIRYGLHAEVLRKILSAGPRSVFVDLLFKDPRPDPSIKSLRETLESYRGGDKTKRTYVYLANERGCGAAGIRPDLAEADGVTPVPVPLRDVDTFDSVIREYPTFAVKDAVANDDPQWECTTAALRMYLDDLRNSYDLRSYRWPFVVRWGGCEGGSVWRLSLRWIAVLFGREVRQDASCLPFDVIPVRDLFSDGSFKAAFRKLQGKFVVYGINLSSVGDLVYSPVHRGPIPGPIAHAMALDNLAQWGRRYLWRIPFAPEDRIRFDLGGIDGDVRIRLSVVDLGLLVFGAIVFVRLRHAPAASAPEAAPPPTSDARHTVHFVWQCARGVAHAILLPFLVFGAVSIVLFIVCHISPVNIAPHIFVWLLVENVTRVPQITRLLT